MAKLVWTAEAERWLRRIHDYIATDKPGAAFGVVESLYRRAEILTEFPDIGHAHTSPSGRQVRILVWVTTGSSTSGALRTKCIFWACSTEQWT